MLNLFRGVVFTGIVEHVEPTSSGYALWGRLEGIELGTMTLVANGSVVAGTVRTPDAVYTIRTAGDTYVIREIDESSLAPLGEPVEAPLRARGASAQTANNPRDDGSEIDVMVVYTPAAKRREGGRAAIEALIDLFVAETNQAYANSGVIHRIRLTLREEVEYLEDSDSHIDLFRLSNDGDGYMDHVHERRDLYAADLVHLVTGTGNTAGTAVSVNVGDESTGFALTVGGVGDLSFAHELGHNMGLRHDRYVDSRGGGSNYGYVNQRAFDLGAPESARWRTIMAYNYQCSEVGYYCTRLPYFSNPDLTYNGDPMGVPADNPSTGVDGPADAVRSLNSNREVVANYRRSATSATPRVGLTLSPYWLSENGGSSTVMAALHRPSNADIRVTISASPAEAVTLGRNRTLTIPAGQTRSVGAVTITGLDNGDRTGDVRVTVSATAVNTTGEDVIAPDPVALAIVDDETTPVVTLSLSHAEIVEEGLDGDPGRTFVTATMDNRSTVETRVIVSASPADAVAEIARNTLTIPAGQPASNGLPLQIVAVHDSLQTGIKKVTVSGVATNSQGVTGPESVILTIIDDEAPVFADDAIAYTFTAGVVGSRFLPEAAYGNGPLTYSISPPPSDGVAFTPGPPARIGISATYAAGGPTSYTLTATDADGDTDAMTVTITARGPVCPNSAAVSGYAGSGIIIDCEALLASRDVLRGDLPLNWSEELSIDKWQGVSIADNRVMELDMSDLRLTGVIPSELGNLANLRSLSLGNKIRNLFVRGNQLTGPIPPELGNLSNLRELHLRDNQLTGQIPAELGSLSNLERLRLGENKLTGDIPAELAGLSNLLELSLWANQLTGPIPAELGSLSNLESLQLSWNQLTGPIPAELGSLSNLESLSFAWNQLTGPIPAELGGLFNLEGLSLTRNQLTGEIPPELGSLSNLERLYLSSNQLTGEIPPELGSLSNLQELELTKNQLTGPIPAKLGNLSNLERLHLGGNQLTGPIPEELGSLSNLLRLYLWDNQLTGPIPAELGSLSRLERLLLAGNQLTGPIPAELGGLSNLLELSLRGNQLTGCIPRGLRNVSVNDLADLGLPFCIAPPIVLTALSVGPRALVPEFDPEHTEYTTTSGMSPITVTATTEDDASIRILDENGDEIADADAAQEGHQVDLGDGVTVIVVEAASPDRETVYTYTVTVTYEDLAVRYDANNDGVIDRDEAIMAVADFFSGAIGREEVLSVIALYFSSI